MNLGETGSILHWEVIEIIQGQWSVERVRVPGGWLVRVVTLAHDSVFFRPGGVALTFVPDPEGVWLSTGDAPLAAYASLGAPSTEPP